MSRRRARRLRALAVGRGLAELDEVLDDLAKAGDRHERAVEDLQHAIEQEGR